MPNLNKHTETKPTPKTLNFKNCSCVYVCTHYCVQLSYTTQQRTVLLIFYLILHRIRWRLPEGRGKNSVYVYTQLCSIIRPHRSSTNVDAAYCYRMSSVVCLSVCHTSEPCKNSWTDQDAVWVENLVGPRNHILDGVHVPHGKWQFCGEKGWPIV